ncbi:MAG: dUTP diphosphatase [Sporolactobacillus sp.]
MNLEKLYEAQSKLDADIVEKKHLQGKNLLPNKILALNVELGELAQEVQGEWKYWKEHTTRDNARVLDEFVDCLHFALSIGLEDADIDLDEIPTLLIDDAGSVGCLNGLFVNVERYGESVGCESIKFYAYILEGLMKIADYLGFNDDQIEAAYFHKNEVNHARQEMDY